MSQADYTQHIQLYNTWMHFSHFADKGTRPTTNCLLKRPNVHELTSCAKLIE